jgi:oligopeptidase B
MIKRNIYLASILIFSFCNQQPMENKQINFDAPIPVKKPRELSIHGDIRIDPYFWMNESENPEVLDYISKENAYTDRVLAHTKDFQQTLFDELKARIKQDDTTVPYFLDGYYYFARYEKGFEYPLYCRKKENLQATEQIMLNVNEMAQGHDYYSVAGLKISPDNKYLAFAVDTLGRRQYTLYVKDLTTNKMLAKSIENTSANAVWAADSKQIFTVQKDKTLRSSKVVLTDMFDAKASIREVYYEADEKFNVGLSLSRSKKYVFISSQSTLSSEIRFVNAETPQADFSIFQERLPKTEYDIEHFNHQFYILTNYKAQNFRLMNCNEDKTQLANWNELIAHRSDVRVEAFELFNDFMVLEERKMGLMHIRIINHKSGEDYYIPFADPAYVAATSTNMEANTTMLRYVYSSLTTPNSTFEFDMQSKKQQLLKQQEVVGGFNAADYQSERIYVRARDGAKVPMSIVYKKGFLKNGTQPILLYGYGSYGITVDPVFSTNRLSLLNRGFAFAIAHIRGSETLGRQWYESGKLLNKKNTFYDFIDCAEYLVNEKFTSTEKLFAMGGSAGGLLMGAVANMRPDLFRGMVAAVPFVDVVTTMLDESIPLTVGEYDEWGNPNIKEYYDYMLSYSPYDNVQKQAYPAMLITTGFHDSQVQYWEPLKWAVKLRENQTANQPILLFINMDAGHSGASGRFEVLKEIALEYAFMLDCVGINE